MLPSQVAKLTLVKTTATLKLFFMQMASRPHIQRLAQLELDGVCPDQLPTLKDRPLCPYVEAILMEVCRWHPPVPEGIPHLVKDEDVWEGLRIPAGSIVIPNIW
jgi:cytochrome P450